MLPCVLFEDEHLLVMNKPAGMNTHAPAPFAPEGLYDFLRHREPRWATLAIHQRLDKDTSGVLVFAKSDLANKSLANQFATRQVLKRYWLLTTHAPKKSRLTVQSRIVRSGDRYLSAATGEPAETRFRILPNPSPLPSHHWIEAEPVSGRTHQIRVHASEQGFPILGDTRYGGEPFARVCLHARELHLHHPASGERVTFTAPVDFIADPGQQLRAALLEPGETDAFRLAHGAADGAAGWYVDRFGPFALCQSETTPNPDRLATLSSLPGITGVYHKTLNRHVRHAGPVESSPDLLLGKPAPARFVVRENGLQFEIRFGEGYSVGLFLDQRENRRRLIRGHVAADFPLAPAGTGTWEVLNTFAYTCAFSVCAARGGARVTSLDLSKKYLDWGRRNFELNGIDPAAHDFIYGDVFDWMKRLGRKGRLFDVVLLDPPTFSQSKAHGAFRAEKDYGGLVRGAVALLRPGGVLFASTNASGWAPDQFLGAIRKAIEASGRVVSEEHFVPQPADFPVTRREPAYLKTVWMRVRQRSLSRPIL